MRYCNDHDARGRSPCATFEFRSGEPDGVVARLAVRELVGGLSFGTVIRCFALRKRESGAIAVELVSVPATTMVIGHKRFGLTAQDNFRRSEGSTFTAARKGSSSWCVYFLFISGDAWPVSFCRISWFTPPLAMTELKPCRRE